MTEQSQMPLVGPPKRRGWREIVRFRPLTASTNAALVVTRRGRLVSVLPAGGPRVLSDYLAWPYDFREVDTRERLLVLDQRLESFDSNYEFSVSLRLSYQVVQPDRVALELEDVSTELAHAVVQSLRLSGRSFGVEQDKAFEEHLQETLLSGDALLQRVHLLGLVLRRADVTVSLDELTRAHAEVLRFAMRERPLHFQLAVESLEPDRNFDVIVGGTYRLTERRVQDGPSDTADSAIQVAIARTLRRVGITFEPSDYSNAAKAMAEVLRKDALLQSELSMFQAQLLRPTVQIQPDRSMVHVPRPTMLGVPDTRPEPALRRARQGLPRMGRPPALVDMQESAPGQAPKPAVRRALPPPEPQPADLAAAWPSPQEPQLIDIAAQWPSPPEPQPADLAAPWPSSQESRPADIAADQILPLGELPAPGEPIEGAYTLWPMPASMPVLRALPALGQPDDAQDADAPWAELIGGAEAASQDYSGSSNQSASLAELVEPLPWEPSAMDEPGQQLAEEHTHLWSAASPVEPLPWESSATEESDRQDVEEHTPVWLADSPATLSALEPLPWELSAMDEPGQQLAEEHTPVWLADSPATLRAALDPLPWEPSAMDEPGQPAFDATIAAEEAENGQNAIFGAHTAAPEPTSLDSDQPVGVSLIEGWSEPAGAYVAEPLPNVSPDVDSLIVDDLGFSLDWSEPGAAAREVEPPAALTPADNAPADDLGFVLDWSESHPDVYAGAGVPSGDATADSGIVMAHWDDPEMAIPDPALVSESSMGADAANDIATTELNPAPVFDHDSAQRDLEQAPAMGLLVPAEHGVMADEAPVISAQESLPWYAPTMQIDDHLPLDSATDESSSVPLESFVAEWAEQPAAPSIPDHDPATAAFPQLPTEAVDQEPVTDSGSIYALAAEADITPVNETFETWAEQSVAPSSLDYDHAADDVNEDLLAPLEVAEAVPAEQIARIIGMIQSYGPAWFKMWSLELKERPERLPVVLGEVTADPVLLAQANDPKVQTALLAALAAYTSPAAFPARLPASVPLPSPAMAGQNDDGEDEVPDWLSLRVKWNGHGGGA